MIVFMFYMWNFTLEKIKMNYLKCNANQHNFIKIKIKITKNFSLLPNKKSKNAI